MTYTLQAGWVVSSNFSSSGVPLSVSTLSIARFNTSEENRDLTAPAKPNGDMFSFFAKTSCIKVV
ncbi:hypothetical protein N0V87_003316 [Didymella glomerata]|uniref:Uncharacterized protein n=1 Tax=Didymella glomerata TaxID=749621 RepID=A0A9W9C2V8_9PLEO|nr:hypothetical protein N0V87_003316 [Didymella glomerata]